jgi:anti-anti-sigma regulatory factor
MAGTAMLTDHGRGGSYGVSRRVQFGLFQAFARVLRWVLERSESRPEERRSATGVQGTVHTRVVDAAGDLCDTRVLEGFHHRCEQALAPGRRCVVVDLAHVTSADTKLVATLITLLRRAQSADVPLEFTVSSHVHRWITLCRVERLLRPTCTHRRTVTPSKVLWVAAGQGSFVR